MIAATFPIDKTFASAPSEVVTDIFSGRPYGTIGSSITGSEASISIGEGIRRIVQSARLTSISGHRVVPPLSTVSEAKQLMNEYLHHVSVRLQGKMQIASSDISDLLFVPADLSTGFINFYGTLGHIQPKGIGDLTTINSILI